VDKFVKRVRESGSLMDKATRFHSRPVRSIENIAAVDYQIPVTQLKRPKGSGDMQAAKRE